MSVRKFGGDSYRSILKWGDPEHFVEPKKRMIKYLKENMGVTEEDFKTPHLPGLDKVRIDRKPALPESDILALKGILGEENVEASDYERVRHSVGFTYLDIVKLRLEDVKPLIDVVVYPRDEADVIAVVRFCNEKKIPLVPFGGRSSVTRGLEPVKGGVSLDLTRHMNRIKEVNEINCSVTVEPGIFGPAYEDYLNNYKTSLSPGGYTNGHFPQSFEYSTVGGWVVTRGAGGLSTGYGKIEDMVLGLRFVTPNGLIVTKDFPRAATGPDLRHLVMGSEGTLGVLTEATLKIWKFQPENRVYFSFVFKDWEECVTSMREIMQGGFGLPHMFRISDPEETSIAFVTEGISATPIDKGLEMLGYKDGKRCLMLGSTEGDKDAGRLIKKKAKAIAKKHGAISFFGFIAVKAWYKHRYNDPYLREELMDIKVMTDTLETACTWENIPRLWSEVRKVVKARPNSVCMVHASHCYENGGNLYFIFLSRIKPGDEVDDFERYHTSIINAIERFGGGLSHHHGIGRMMAPWYEEYMGETGMGVLRAIKIHLDPNNIMNPGGTLALDFTGEKKKAFKVR